MIITPPFGKNWLIGSLREFRSAVNQMVVNNTASGVVSKSAYSCRMSSSREDV